MWFATPSLRGRGDYDRVIPPAFDRNPDLGAKQQSLYLRLVREAPGRRDWCSHAEKTYHFVFAGGDAFGHWRVQTSGHTGEEKE